MQVVLVARGTACLLQYLRRPLAENGPVGVQAISPHYAFAYLGRNGKVGWEALSGVLLCFTGAQKAANPGRNTLQLSF